RPAAAAGGGRRGLLRRCPGGHADDQGQPRLRPPPRRHEAGARRGGHRPRPERHRLSGRRRHRLCPFPGPLAQALRVLLLAHLDGRRGPGVVGSRCLRGTPPNPGGAGMSDQWRLLTHDGVEAAAGLALDEALLAGYAREADPAWPPTLRLYTYRSHCALVGRYQHLEAEVDLDACRRTGTGCARRPTGGGAIVMGAGQLGVAVATRAPADVNPRALLGRYAEGIVAGLAELGIE